MIRRSSFYAVCAIVLLGSLATRLVSASDWPAYRHDLARSGVTRDRLAGLLHSQWIYQAAQRPRPAWAEPGRELNRLAFDYVYQPVAGDGLVFFGSSADHRIHALDLATGAPKWSFCTEGPVRFAPTMAHGRLFVGSDDGYVYCLGATDGKLIWKFRAGPRDERMIGNGQLMSRWPIRSGVAVDDGVVYFAAGMWPNEGVFFYALNATDGRPVWLNDTSGIGYIPQPHPPSLSVSGVAPQGYLLGSQDQLFLPTGRNVAAAYDRADGKLLYYRSRPNTWGDRWGGSWNMLVDGLLLSWRCHVGPDIDVLKGEYQPDPKDGIVAFDAATGKVVRDFPGKLQAVMHGGTLYMSGSGKISAYDFAAWRKGTPARSCTKWETPHGRAYAMILAGNTLVVGGRGTVTTLDAQTGKSLWRDTTDGQARGLAVADGRLLVSTTTGQIICYAAKSVPEATRIAPSAARVASDGSSAESDPPAVREMLARTGKTDGYCLVLGTRDGRLLRALAEHSSMTVYCCESDPRNVARARALLDQSGLYGTRVTVQQGTPDSIGYPEFFADLIVVTDTSDAVAGIGAKSLYRALHPYGGRMYLRVGGAAGKPDAVMRWLAAAKVPGGEIHVMPDAVQVVRGALPGAGDWTHQYGTAARPGSSQERRARVPLKLLWFGEPGPAELISRHWKGQAPLCINGRMFVVGQNVLLAVDPYNGRPLWRRDLPKVGRFPVVSTGANVAADAENVYVVTGKKCLRLRADTGVTAQTYPVPPLPDELAKTNYKWGYLAVGSHGLLGTAGSDRESRVVFLLAQDGTPRWLHRVAGVVGHNAIAMDTDRVYLIEQTRQADIDSARRRGTPIPAAWQLVALDAATGHIAWKTTQAIAGRTELWLSEGVLLATGQGKMAGYDASSGKLRYERAVSMRHFPVLVGDTIYGEPIAYDLHTGQPRTRKDPISTQPTTWTFLRSYGCGSMAAGQNLLLFRSSTLGMDDLLCDTGVHNFGGVRAGCYVNAIAAGGLVLMPTSDAGCTCSYCYQTTVALTPADKNENWSIFFERLPRESVGHAALNLGAPGDQRDGTGRLWIATPRPPTVGRRQDIAVPFRFAAPEDYGAYRVDSDLVSIDGTDRPWIYTSGLKGSVRGELDLDILDRGITAWPADGKIVLDAMQHDPSWNGYKEVAARGPGARAVFRYDDQNLYIAYKRPAGQGEDGRLLPWKRSVTEADGPVWKDDSFEIYLSALPKGHDVPSRRYLHLGLSPSGACYDALWQYVTPALPECAIPKVNATIDGKTNDWDGQGLEVVSLPGPGGLQRAASDLDPSLRIGWNGRGIVLLVHVKDNAVCPATGKQPLQFGDCVELFVAPERGSDASYRLVIAPDAQGDSTDYRSRFDDLRKTIHTQLAANIAARRTRDGYVMEVCLPWDNLRQSGDQGSRFAMQVFVNDNDRPGQKFQFQARWHPAGDPRLDRLAYQTFRVADRPSKALVFKRARAKNPDGLFATIPPYPFPQVLPTIGAQKEDVQYSAQWDVASRAITAAIAAEIAIPWKTIAAAGLDKSNLMINVTRRGPLAEAPVLGKGFERLIIVPARCARPREVSVRLHFAELDDVRPGQRVFDIMLQKQVVLSDFDVMAAAGGKNRAVIRQFDHIPTTGFVRVELVPKSGSTNTRTAPILSGVEILAP